MKYYREPLSEKDLAEIAECLDNDGVVLLPTDTVYGVAARPDRPDAVARIRILKKRDAAKPMQLLADSLETAAARSDVIFEKRALDAARRYWPGPLTLVLDRTDGGTEGIRVPDNKTAVSICKAAGGMLRCTSANESGEPPALDAGAAARALPGADAVVDGGPAAVGAASTVAAVKNSGVTVFRKGPVDTETL